MSSASPMVFYSRRWLFSALAVLSFLLLVCLAAYSQAAPPADDDYPDQYDETARVARISYLEGTVSLKRDGRNVWEEAQANYPLVEGDVLATERGARVELQINGRNFVRVGGDSLLRVVTLRDVGVALSLSEGVATVYLTRFDKDREYFEIDAPHSTLAAEKTGNYRADAAKDGRVRFTVRGGGRARIYSESSGFTLRDDKTAELVFYAADDSDWNVTNAASYDRWDDWTLERERYVTARYRYDDGYTDARIWGAEDLSAYGDWTYAQDYGWLWRPHASEISRYRDWSPYRYGNWTWCPPYGWTWAGSEPWGWAPYHYGRWQYYNNSWYWSPRGYGSNVTVYHRWRPALVSFVYINNSYNNNYVTWYPLGWNQRDPRGRHYRDNNRRFESLSASDIARLERTNPAFVRAVSGLPARNFGNGRRGEIQAVPTDLARRTLGGEPLRGRLPVTPADIADRADGGSRDNVEGNGTTRGGRRARGGDETTVTTGATLRPELQPRETGAARRAAGRPLDDELRRARIYNGREPRGAGINGGGNNNSIPLENGNIRPDGGARRADDNGGTGVFRRSNNPRPRDTEPVGRENGDNINREKPGARSRPVAPPVRNGDDNRPAQIEPQVADRPLGAPARRREDKGDNLNNDGARPMPRPIRRNEDQPRDNNNDTNSDNNNYRRPTRPSAPPPQREERRPDPPQRREERREEQQRRPDPPPVAAPPRREEQRRPDPPRREEQPRQREEQRRPDPPQRREERREEPARPPAKAERRDAELEKTDNR